MISSEAERVMFMVYIQNHRPIELYYINIKLLHASVKKDLYQKWKGGDSL
jgi:hypothetical protein